MLEGPPVVVQESLSAVLEGVNEMETNGVLMVFLFAGELLPDIVLLQILCLFLEQVLMRNGTPLLLLLLLSPHNVHTTIIRSHFLLLRCHDCSFEGLPYPSPSTVVEVEG